MGTDRFYSKELDTEQQCRVSIIKTQFTNLHNMVDNFIQDGREKSLYITKLEEACMWAVKAVSMEEPREVNKG